MENEMSLVDAAISDVDDFNPDGLDEIVALLSSDSNSPDAFATDGPAPAPEDFPADSDSSTSETPGTTPAEENKEAVTEDAETDAPAKEPDGEPEPVKKSRVLKLKVNKEFVDADVDAMSDEELTAELQMGRAYKQLKAKYDALRAKEGQATYRKVYQEQLDNGMTESVAHLVAKDAAGGQEYSLDEDIATVEDTDEVETVTDTITQSNATEQPVGRDFKAEYQKLKVLYPELTTVPSEVVDVAVSNDIGIVESYQAYLGRQHNKTVAAENATLKKENSILKQNEASAKRAPVTGVSGGGANAQMQKRDLWLEGFDSSW